MDNTALAVVIWFAMLGGGWYYTLEIKAARIKIFLRSIVIAVCFAPGLLAVGHGVAPAPAIFVIPIYLASRHKEYALQWGVLPLIVTWVVVFGVWISIHEIRRLWKDEKRSSDTAHK